MSQEYPVEQSIGSAVIGDLGEGMLEYVVGQASVTRIEACTKSGPYSEIPYIRIWSGDVAMGEFCQHNIVGITFQRPGT